jgi:hypothetical protein
MSETVPASLIQREQMRGATDDFLRRPLWLFDPAERRAVLAERARRWGVPDGEADFDPEYH